MSYVIAIVLILIIAGVVFFFIRKKRKEHLKSSHPSQSPTPNTASSDNRSKIRRIEIVTRKLSNQVFAGSYHSAFKGRGISFSEVREYQYGDDVRFIDWNVTARGGKPFIKVFDEERELTMMLMIDVSKSTLFGTQNEFKKEIIEIISGILAFSAITNNDKVGVLFFSDKVEKYIPAKKGKSHILRIISEIDTFESKGKGTNISEMLQYFNNANKKKSIAFLISDFQAPVNYEKPLAIVANKHDLLGIQVYDKAEHLLEDIGLVNVKDAESGDTFYVNAGNSQVRKNVRTQFETKQQNLEQLFAKKGAQFVSMATTDDYVKSLMKLFKERGVRKGR